MSSRKREFHPRKKSGCVTCRIRKVKCDEMKPFCNRCTTTGRKCDGYALQIGTLQAPSRRPPPIRSASVAQSLAIPLPKRDDQELRSYRFFLNVSASVLSGIFDDDFWRIDIPRTCHSDAAIWHAVVSLGAAHEYFLTKGTKSPTTTEFAFRQYNMAVRQLLHVQSSQDLLIEKWRAVVSSVLFTYLCSIQGLHYQATLHLTACIDLLQELRQVDIAQAIEPETTPRYLRVSSVSYSTILSIVSNLETQTQTLGGVEASKIPPFFSRDKTHNAWRYYTAPPQEASTCQHGGCVPSRATPAALISASRASQSLLDSLVRLSHEDASKYDSLIQGVDDISVMEELQKRKDTFTRTFRELRTSLIGFYLDVRCTCASSPLGPEVTALEQIKGGIDRLGIYMTICSLLLFGYASYCSPPKSEPLDLDTDIMKPLSAMLEKAENLLQQEEASKPVSATPSFLPKLSISQPLLITAVNGPTVALRRRAIELLEKFRRRDGLMDTELMASVARAILDREVNVAHRGLASEAFNGLQVQDQNRSEIWGMDKRGEDLEAIPPDCQIRWVVLTFEGPSLAKLEMKTLREWLSKKRGVETSLAW